MNRWLVALVLGTQRQRLIALIVLVAPWALGAALYWHSWTQPSGAPVSVAVVQGAIPQDEKWLESNHDTTLNLYQGLTEKVLGTRLIVWPESAPADVANNLVPYISNLYSETRAHGFSIGIRFGRILESLLRGLSSTRREERFRQTQRGLRSLCGAHQRARQQRLSKRRHRAVS